MVGELGRFSVEAFRENTLHAELCRARRIQALFEYHVDFYRTYVLVDFYLRQKRYVHL